MGELSNFPLDAQMLMRKKRTLRRELLARGGFVDKRIAVLGGSTTHDIIEIMELFLLDSGIKPMFYEGEYAQFYEDAMFGNEVLDGFKPDVIFVHTSSRNIQEWPEPGMSRETIEGLFSSLRGKFEAVWLRLGEKFRCPVIQNNFEYLPYRLFGNLDAAEIHGRTNFINRANSWIANWAQSHDGFYVNDINWQSADFGLSRWHDPFCWYMYKYALSLEAVPTLAFNVSNIIKAIFGKNKKALAIDLDNTLWGGVVGDDGPENLEIGTETAVGQAYTEFQQYLKNLSKQGVLLNVISKNEAAAAKSGLAHPRMVLKEKDFISIKANWSPKSRNLVEMAEELSLLPESFVFIDDNPAEREIIRQQVPGCSAPELSSVEHYISEVDRGGYFESVNLSGDDLRRNAMYKENAARSHLRNSFADYGEYLKSLAMKAEIKPFEAVYMGRIAQLTNKSNQFNLTTMRCTREEIEAMAKDDCYITRYGSLSDKFGDNGVVAVSIGKLAEIDGMRELQLVLWLMSCRVLKRDMEFAMMDEMVAAAIERGCKRMRGFYYPTEKNAMVKSFYATQGFSKISEDDAGNAVWALDVSGGYTKKNANIEVSK